ncbi:unnamed protein product, partial [Nippostrongylus brasiliensis]|uniref:G_PROTEIN_RECEP_F1_2 domain-containing protein n=1 Tax=Nippostrongylus brasiliensis TaxID=27835 RepID=A0A0N4YSW6_NIPBR
VAQWSNTIFAIGSVVTIPLYVTIIVLLLTKRKLIKLSNTFSWLIISQGFADVIYMTEYLLFGVFCYFANMDIFDTKAKNIVADLFSKFLVYFTALRGIGIMFISVQRYMIICRWPSKLNTMIVHARPIYLVLTHWLLSALVTSPVFIFTSAKFGLYPDWTVIYDRRSLRVVTAVNNFSVSVPFIICIICYAATLRRLFNKHWANFNTAKMVRESRLCFQIKVNLEFRSVHPILSGLLSFVVPWTLFLFNKELSTLIKQKVQCRCLSTRNRCSVPPATWTTTSTR